MKKVLQSIGVFAALTAGVQANAQVPDYGVWPSGVTFTDINSNTYDIDAILDAGKSVVIDAFADWCGPCWTYHTAGTLEDLYLSVGPSGSDVAMVFGLEADPGEPEANISDAGTGQGDWTLGGTVQYPLCDDDNIAGIINLGYYPTLILVCPDRSVTEIGQQNQATWEAAISNCGGLATNANDPRILSNESDANVTLCGGGSASADIIVAVQNYSNSAINGNYDIEATLGGNVVASTTATLNLAPYEATEVTVGTAALALGNNNVTVTITTANDDTGNDAIAAPIMVEEAADLGIGDIVLDVNFDAWGGEVGYGLASGTVQETDPFAAYPDFSGSSYPGQVDFQAIGTWSDGDAGFTEYYPSLTAGCYHLYMFDNYGDGLTSGSITLTSPNSSASTTMDTDYGSGGWTTFEVTTDGTGGFAGIEETNEVEFATVFPNPAVDMTNVQFNLTEAANVTVEVFNVYGQIVFSDNMGEVNGLQNVEVSTSDLESGMYIVNINVNGNVLSKRVSVVK